MLFVPEVAQPLMECHASVQGYDRRHACKRQCRIKSAPDEVGVADLRSRKKAVLESTRSMIQALGRRDTSDILWLTRERVIAHQTYVEGIAGATMHEKEEKKSFFKNFY